jgi:molybdopterin/thiamine biosynthesis adenylyltransferase
MVRDINPEVDLRLLPKGLDSQNLGHFLDGVDLYMDSLDIFALDIRRKVFALCYERNIPAITAAPMGMGTALLAFAPGGMSFERYFAFGDEPFEDQVLKFVVGVSPSMQQRHYLVDRRSVDFFAHKVPSLAVGIELAAGVACSTALKILLARGEVKWAPWGLHFDAYRNRLIRTWRPFGNRHPMQRLMFWWIKRLLAKARQTG